MIILLSPSKGQNFEQTSVKDYSQPQLLDQSKQLMAVLKPMSQAAIKSLMSISDQLAELNHQRFQEFTTPFKPDNAKPAVLAFKGDVYSGLKADTWRAADFKFAQKHLRILSGLYGYLRPLDLIMPYRLEMKTKLPTKTAKDLYGFWDSLLTDCLNRELTSDDAVINLASNEYYKALQPKQLKAPVINIQFKDEKEGKVRVIAIYAKIARGAMARAIIQNKVTQADKIKKLVVDDYRYQEALSGDLSWTFTRRQPPPKS